MNGQSDVGGYLEAECGCQQHYPKPREAPARRLVNRVSESEGLRCGQRSGQELGPTGPSGLGREFGRWR